MVYWVLVKEHVYIREFKYERELEIESIMADLSGSPSVTLCVTHRQRTPQLVIRLSGVIRKSRK